MALFSMELGNLQLLFLKELRDPGRASRRAEKRTAGASKRHQTADFAPRSHLPSVGGEAHGRNVQRNERTDQRRGRNCVVRRQSQHS
jgi:hypothetical protein